MQLAARLADRYEFMSLLGRGGWGSVFEVRNRQLGRREALKVASEDVAEGFRSRRFSHEVKIVAALDHPRIVKVYAFGEEEGIQWYSMQLVDGPTLADLLQVGWSFDAAMAARIAVPIMDALAYSHEQGVVHRDIKPANILFNQEGRPFLADFGIAKTWGDIHETQTGQLLGTPAYLSPEQALGEDVDARADQYALGITLYRTLAGCFPFSEEGAIQTLMQRVQEEPEPIMALLPHLDPAFGEVIMRAMSREKSRRWAGLLEMREAMVKACAAEGIIWNLPLEGVGRCPLTRQPLEPFSMDGIADGHHPGHHPGLDPTVDLPKNRSRRSLGSTLVGAALLAALVLLAWNLPRKAAPSPALSPAPFPASSEASADAKPAPARSVALPQTHAAPASKAVPAEASPRRVVTYPQLIEGPTPPATVPASCLGAKVAVSLVVGEDGTVKSCRLLSHVAPECIETAKALAMAFRYRPALDGEGKPIESTVAAAIDFPEAP
jgi:serine/threonine-protein kinase